MDTIGLNSTSIKSILSKSNFLYLCFIVLCAFSFVHNAVKTRIESPFTDLAYFYFNASMERQGLDMFDSTDIKTTEKRIPIRRCFAEAVYPPAFFTALAPFTILPFSAFKTLWVLLGCLSLLFVLVYLLKLEKVSDPLVITALCYITAYYQPFKEALALGQTDWIVLLLAALAWDRIKKDRPGLAGLCIAAMSVAKLHFIVLVPALLLLRQWKVFGYAALCSLLIHLAGLPFLGFGHYINWFHAFFAYGSSDFINSAQANIGFNGMFHRLMPGRPEAAYSVYLAFIALLGLPILVRLLRNGKGRPDWDFLVCLPMVLVIAPLTELQHLTILLLPVILCTTNLSRLTGTARMCYFLGLVLVASRYSWNRFAESHSLLLTPLLSLPVLGAYLCALAVLLLRNTYSFSRPPAMTADPARQSE